MKIKHNKKRNTGFVFESLIREMTVAVIKKEDEKKHTILKIIQKHFRPNTALQRDLDNYRSLYENQNLDQLTSEKILKEAKLASRMLDPNQLFDEQTELINDINKEVSSSVYNNFVPNYKTLASIHQIFSDKLSPKNQVILENEIVADMCAAAEQPRQMASIDSLTLDTFAEKFNAKYEQSLMAEQKELLNMYINSFHDNGIGLKTYLNNEIARLKGEIENCLQTEEIKSDEKMAVKTLKVGELLENLYKQEITDASLLQVLKTQELVRIISEDVG